MAAEPGERGPDASPALLQAQELHRAYEVGVSRVLALRGVSFSIQPGEVVSIVGASGAGKSTLLHILGGLEKPSAGRVVFKGQDLYALPPGQRTEVRAARFGFVFQSYHLLPELDVVENVMLPAMTRGRRGRGAGRARALELLERVGLGARSAHRPTELSGGEQQRVALARALMNDPEVVLADEPTGNLDSKTGGLVLDYLLELTRERGHTLILVTHNEAVAALCQRKLVLHDGILAF